MSRSPLYLHYWENVWARTFGSDIIASITAVNSMANSSCSITHNYIMRYYCMLQFRSVQFVLLTIN